MLTGHFLGEQYLESLLVKSGYTLFTPENLSLVEQMRQYLEADVVLFAEGSACHGVELLGKINATSYLIPRRKHAASVFIDLLSKHFLSCKLISSTIELPTLVHLALNKQTPHINAADCIITPEVIINLEKENQITQGLYNYNDYIASLEEEFSKHILNVTNKIKHHYYQNLGLYSQTVFDMITGKTDISLLSSITINGALDGLNSTIANGWVHITGNSIEDNVKPLITISLNREVIAEGFATDSRPGLENLEGGIAAAFFLKLNKEITHINNPTDLSVVASYKNVKANLRIYKPIELALQFQALNEQQQASFLKYTSAT
jgi:hypothetical protein